MRNEPSLYPSQRNFRPLFVAHIVSVIGADVPGALITRTNGTRQKLLRAVSDPMAEHGAGTMQLDWLTHHEGGKLRFVSLSRLILSCSAVTFGSVRMERVRDFEKVGETEWLRRGRGHCSE